MRNADNRGFGAACNQGAAGSDADFLLFLNPDTRLMPGSLAEPVRYLRSPEHETVGIVGIQLFDADGHVARNTARAPTAWSMVGNSVGLDRLMPRLFPPHFVTEWAHDETRPVDQVMGAFFLVRRSVFEALGGFDERFFVYYEDLDFSVRARAHGWSSVYLATRAGFPSRPGHDRRRDRAADILFLPQPHSVCAEAFRRARRARRHAHDARARTPRPPRRCATLRRQYPARLRDAVARCAKSPRSETLKMTGAYRY